MNFLELCQWVVGEADRDKTLLTTVDENALVDDMHKKVVGWVKQAYRAILRDQKHWGFLFQTGKFITLRDGVCDYAVPNVRAVDKGSWVLQKTNSPTTYPLLFIKYSLWKDLYSLVISTYPEMMPMHVTQIPSGEFRFTPTPDKTYNVLADWYLSDDEMLEEHDEPLWDEEFHEIVGWRALSYYAAEYDVPALASRVGMNLPAISRKFKNRYLPDIER